MNLWPVINSLRAVVIQLEGQLPARDVEIAWDYLDHCEPGLALEQICCQLDELEIPITTGTFATIVEAGQSMDMSDALWRDLRIKPE